MKKTIYSLFIAALAIIGLTSSEPIKENMLIGKWEMAKSKINGQIDPTETMNRTQEFKDDKTFEGRYSPQNGVSQLYNKGKYFMADDTTMVTIHYDQNGRLDKLSFVYTVKIQNDTLHLSGFYTRPVGPGTLSAIYIDEYWVRKQKNDFL